jgi:hypothetical protein
VAHVHAASELRHPAALPFLRNLILTPIPPEESPDPHSFSTVGEETILRTTAVEGIGYLARGRADPTEMLFEALRQPSLSIRRAAVQSLLATARGRRLRARIARALPEEHQFLVDLKAVSVRDVPQIRNPAHHLSEAGRRGGIAPAPSLPGDEANTTAAPPPRRKERDMATCSVPTIPDKTVTGDSLYCPRACWQAFIDWAWSAHGFRKTYWDDGFGYEDCCNTDLPLARIFGAMWLLNYSADDYWNEDWSNNCLHWARRYVRDQINDLRSLCGDGTNIAWSGSGRVELYLGCFYRKDCAPDAPKPCCTNPVTSGGSRMTRTSPQARSSAKARVAPTRPGATKEHGCTLRSISGGSMPTVAGRRRRCARRRGTSRLHDRLRAALKWKEGNGIFPRPPFRARTAVPGRSCTSCLTPSGARTPSDGGLEEPGFSTSGPACRALPSARPGPRRSTRQSGLPSGRGLLMGPNEVQRAALLCVKRNRYAWLNEHIEFVWKVFVPNLEAIFRIIRHINTELAANSVNLRADSNAAPYCGSFTKILSGLY